jgi:ribosomal protein S13
MTCRPVHAAVVAGPDGDVLRLWEWERTRDLVLQVDLSLPRGSDRLYASTRVINPDPEEKPLYYWTNIAVPESPGTRVLTTADTAWRTEYTGALRRVPVPHPDRADVDISRPMASTSPADYFYDVQAQRGRHIVSVEPDGRGFAEASTRGLRGRKLFLWGSGPAGSRWQEWLCGPDARYAEIQAGWCPTQLEHDRLAGGSSVSWTEAFGGVELDPDEGRLGVDAATIGTAQLRDVLASEAPLKARLLDQARIAGIGNLLADEMLWRAGLDPARTARSLSPAEVRRLHRHLRATLAELDSRGGSHTGDLQEMRSRDGLCPRDGTPLLRRTVGGRTTYSCPRHQR